jgi:hypothetical protein
VSLYIPVEPGHELTATQRDPDGRWATLCECGWVSVQRTGSQPFREARDHILSVRRRHEDQQPS